MLTGATGFLGKVILEKMLRTITGLKKIYVMVRPRKNTTIRKRMDDTIFDSPIFAPLFESKPDLKAHLYDIIHPIAGDLIMEGLGMNLQERELLI